MWITSADDVETWDEESGRIFRASRFSFLDFFSLFLLRFHVADKTGFFGVFRLRYAFTVADIFFGRRRGMVSHEVHSCDYLVNSGLSRE